MNKLSLCRWVQGENCTKMNWGGQQRERGLKPERLKAGWGFGEPALSLPAVGLGEHCKLLQWGPGQSPIHWKVFLHFRGTRWPLLELNFRYKGIWEVPTNPPNVHYQRWTRRGGHDNNWGIEPPTSLVLLMLDEFKMLCQKFVQKNNAYFFYITASRFNQFHKNFSIYNRKNTYCE